MTLTYTPLLFPLFTWFFSLSGTVIALILLKRFAVFDTPVERSNHTVPVPRGGGVPMIVFALLFLACSGAPSRIITAGLLLAIVSFLDDLRSMPVGVRLGAQLVAVIIAIPAMSGRILPEFVPLFVEHVLIVLAWIWFINLTNFMDGIDGITSMQTMVNCVGICLLAALCHALPSQLALHASIVAAAVLGFYWFNRSPAKTFMGDVGSIPLGFLLFYLLLDLALNGAVIPALILPAYYVSDATFTLARRLMRGEKVWQAHSEHAYQKAVRKGLTHTQVVHKITMLNICLVMLALFATVNMIAGIIMLVAGYALVAFVIRGLSSRFIL